MQALATGGQVYIGPHPFPDQIGSCKWGLNSIVWNFAICLPDSSRNCQAHFVDPLSVMSMRMGSVDAAESVDGHLGHDVGFAFRC